MRVHSCENGEGIMATPPGTHIGRTWSEIFQRHGTAMLYLIGLFGWVVVVPLYGAGTVVWATAHGTSAALLFNWFLIAHAPSLVLSGMYLDRHPRRVLPLARLVPLADGALTLLMLTLPPLAWPYLFAAMGIVTAFGMTIWGRWYATSVETKWLGQAFALTAAGIAVFHGGFGYLVKYVPVSSLLLWALLPLLLAWASSRALTGEHAPCPERSTASLPLRARISAAVRFGLFICCFSIVAGLSDRFFVEVPISPYVHDFIRMAPYIVGVLISGTLSDRRGLLSAMVAGAGLLATAFLIGAWSDQPLPALIGIVFNGLAFGLLEPAPWLLLASSATPETAGRWFGWGLNLNVIPILFGAVVAIPHITPSRLGLMATVFTLLAILILYGVTDPLAALQISALLSGGANADFSTAADQFTLFYCGQLTERELDVGKLAIAGVSNRDIAKQMFLSENTVKTHLKSLFRKTGCANRNDLFRKVVEANKARKA